MSEIIVKMKSDNIKIKGGEYIRDLVRCKDCKYWRDTDHTCKHSFTSPRCANDYCSYGERAEE